MKFNFLLTIFIAAVLIIPLVSADSPFKPSGYTINSYISNINESQEYVFISVAKFGDTPILGQCMEPITLVTSDGWIPPVSCYRDDIESSSVYAVRKDKFDEAKFSSLYDEDLWNYIVSLSPVEVLTNVPSNTAADRSGNSKAGVRNYYTVNYTQIAEGVVSPVTPIHGEDEEGSDYGSAITAFILTFLIELGVVKFFMKKWAKKKKIDLKKIALYVFLINLFTWPIANFILYDFIGMNLLIVELIVVILETFLLKWAFKLEYKKALLLSFVANLASAIIGGFILLIIS